MKIPSSVHLSGDSRSLAVLSVIDVNTIVERASGLPIAERIRANLPALSPAERRVAERVLAAPSDVIHLSVTELAALADTSAASVVRFCTSIELRGFQELKITLARETIPVAGQVLAEINADDTAADITSKVLRGTSAALAQAAEVVDGDAILQICDAIIASRRVSFGAVGTSAPLAADVAYRLSTIGIDASFVPDVHAQHVAARMLTPDDVFFAISHTGSTFETLAAVRAAKAAGATVAALTSFVRSPLTEIADLVLVAGSPETAYRVEAMVSRVVHLTVLDAIFVTLSLRDDRALRAQSLAADVLIEHRI